MGKRELVLIALFAIVGVVVYQVTAPPPQPGSQGFSLSRIMQSMRRGIHGNRASAQIDRTRTEPVDSSVQELRFVIPGTELTVAGEDRADIAIQMHVTSSGFDDAEAKRLAEVSTLTVTRAGPALVFNIKFPPEARQSAVLTLKVPEALTHATRSDGRRQARRQQPDGSRGDGHGRRHVDQEHCGAGDPEPAPGFGVHRRGRLAQADLARRRQSAARRWGT